MPIRVLHGQAILIAISDHPSIIHVDRGFYLLTRGFIGTVRRPGVRVSGLEGEGAKK